MPIMDRGCSRRIMHTITTPLLLHPQNRRRAVLPLNVYPHSHANIRSGFTLIEVLVVIAVAAILMSIALPNLANFIANARTSTAANDLVSDLMFTRSLASSNQFPAIVCPPSNAPATNTSCAATVSCSATPNDWIFLGRIVFIDANLNGKCDGNETIIRYTAPTLTPDTSGALTSIVPNFTGNPNNWLAFNPYGTMVNPGGAITSGSFKLCVKGASQCRQISIDFSGRPSVTKVPW